MDRCRLCLAYTEGIVVISEYVFCAKLEMIFNRKFPETYNLPKKVCHGCVTNVQQFRSFFEHVIQTQEQLSIELGATNQGDSKDYTITSDHDSKNLNISREECETNDRNGNNLNTTMLKSVISLDNIDQNSATQHSLVMKDVNVKKLEEKTTSSVNHVQKDDEDDDKNEETNSEKDAQIRLKETGKITKISLNARMKDHIAFHVKPDTYRCELCQKNYRSRYTLQQHTKMHNAEPKERPFKCDKCHQTYEKRYQLKAHSMRHIQAPCHLCDKILSSDQALRVHINHMHGTDEKQICDTCGKVFRTRIALERHVRGHVGQEVVEKRQCPLCGAWVNGERGLKNHTRNVHPNKDEVFECDICQQRCKNATTLYQHRRGVHAQDQYECEYCGKRFKRKIYLKEHRALHTEQLLYSCSVCDHKTKSNANMYSHIKRQHPIEWQETQKQKQLAVAAIAEKSAANR